jgi:hypothetical protein
MMNHDVPAADGQELPNVLIDPDAARTGAGPGVGRPGARPPGRIVVGVDGSDCSVEALRWAARHAELTGATIDAVISWEYPTSWGMEFGVIDVDWEANAQQALDTAIHQAFGADLVGPDEGGPPFDTARVL